MSTLVPKTARTTFHLLAFRVSEKMQPTGRAKAIADTLRQEADIAGSLPCSLADALGGFKILSQPRAADEPPHVSDRRAMCAEFAVLIGPEVIGGDPQALARMYRAVERQLFGSPDGRQAAVAARAGREASEIEDAFSLQGVLGTVTWQADHERWLLQVRRITAAIDGPPPTADAGATGTRLIPMVRPLLAEAGLLSQRPMIAVIDPDGKQPYADLLDTPAPVGGYALAQLVASGDGELTVAVPMGGTVTVL